MHEELITTTDGLNTLDRGKYYVIAPNINAYMKKCDDQSISYERLRANFNYKSDTNPDFLNVKDLRYLIKNSI